MKLGKILNEIDFSSQAAFDAYKKAHKMRDTTKVNVAGKDTTVGAASKKSAAPKAEPKKAEEPKKETPKKSTTKHDLGVDSVVYNTRTKTVGIVRLGDEKGETKTDADGNVNTSELEPYNPMKYPHQKDATVAPSTKKEVETRGLWNPFAPSKSASDKKEEPKKEEPKKDSGFQTPKRQGSGPINKSINDFAEKEGFTYKKLGPKEYKTKMMQAAVSALTDANFHQEARELVAKLEGKPEWAKKPEYPSPSDKDFDKKMKAIRTNSAEASEYMQPDGKTWAFGRDIAEKAGWGGVEAIDGIAFTLRMNGFHREADTIQSIFDGKPYMKDTK